VRGRGLKLVNENVEMPQDESPSVRGRGLKQFFRLVVIGQRTYLQPKILPFFAGTQFSAACGVFFNRLFR
jgi:hypothetical protein